MSLAHKPRKRFGQNFLNDPLIISKLIKTISPKSGEKFVEIGPGLGALTVPLLKVLGSLSVVELDKDLIPKLERVCQRLGELTIYQADVLSFEFSKLSAINKSLRVVGNLPYNISTPLLFHLLKFAPLIKDMHFMLQKEVVERMVAKPGHKTYGRLSIMTQYYCAAAKQFFVPPEAFMPSPKVDSAIVWLKPYTELPAQAQDEILFGQIVRDAFSQRRKVLSNSLKSFISAEQLKVLDIEPTQRPEMLTVQQFVDISNYIGSNKDVS